MIAEALTFVEPARVEWQPLTLPPRLDGQVTVRTLYSGISTGTELLAFRGEIDRRLPLDETIDALDGDFSYPFRYGYSCVGEIEDGDSATEGSMVFAYHPHQTRFHAAGDQVLMMPTHPRRATLFPLVETALQIVADARVVLGEQVVVMGAGAVGILTALILGRNGADVILAEPVPWRRELASDAGISSAHPDALGDLVHAELHTIVDTSGNPEVPGRCLPLLGHEGTLLIASWYGSKPVVLPLGADFHRRRLVIRSSQVSSIPSWLSSKWSLATRRRQALELLDQLPLDALTTNVFPRLEAQAVFEALDRREEGLLHATLHYEA